MWQLDQADFPNSGDICDWIGKISADLCAHDKKFNFLLQT